MLKIGFKKGERPGEVVKSVYTAATGFTLHSVPLHLTPFEEDIYIFWSTDKLSMGIELSIL